VLVVNGNHNIMIPTVNSYVLSQNLPKAHHVGLAQATSALPAAARELRRIHSSA
jgi:hypothetical protein